MKPSTYCEMVLTARRLKELGVFPPIDCEQVEDEAEQAIRRRIEG